MSQTPPNLRAKISFNAEANKNYQLDFVTDIGTQFFGKDSYADIWIKDKATDKSVTEVVRTTPPPAPRTISYPIIINNRWLWQECWKQLWYMTRVIWDVFALLNT